MNAAIYGKKGDTIGRFLRNATGEMLPNGQVKITTANGASVTIKTSHFGIIWTLEDEKPETVKNAKPAPTIGGVSVGSKENVNELSVKKIREKYSLDDELKILRKAVEQISSQNGIPLENEFYDYDNFVGGVVGAGKEFKNKHFKE